MKAGIAALFNPPAPAVGPARKAGSELADFSIDRRVLLLVAMALVVGVIGALAAWVLLWLIAAITNLAFYHRFSSVAVGLQNNHLGLWLIPVPVVGALVVGLMARYGSEKIRGHGIPEALEAILLGRSRIAPKVAILKPISAAISIGTGGPFGAEGPIIMTGGAFGSIFAQQFHLSAAERKTLLVAGAAAGMSAVFATPVAAVLLAVELLLFEWKPRSFIPVAAAAAVASVMRIPLLGMGPIFPVIAHAAPSGEQLLFAGGLGILVGFGSGLLTMLVYACEDLFQKLPIHWMWWPAIGAVFVGIGGLIEPRVLGVGYDSIHGLLRGEMIGHGGRGFHDCQGAGVGDRVGIGHVRGCARAVAHHGWSAWGCGCSLDSDRRRRPLGDGGHVGHDGRHDASAVDGDGVYGRTHPRF